MQHPEPLVEIWRGSIMESQHYGQIVVCGPDGDIIQSWGDPKAVTLPRSSSKMIQALPLVTSGAAKAFDLGRQHLALACASHNGAPVHVDAVTAWLDHLEMSTDCLMCGPQPSRDKALRIQMIRDGETPSRVHNNCSGKHTGFLTLSKHLGAGPDYVDTAHPVQRGAREIFEEVTAEVSPGFGVDGCSAPNWAVSMEGMARAMAWFATASQRNDVASRAAQQLTEAMMIHPDLVAGEGRACTRLMRAATQPVALKTGAEGYFVAILPDQGIGVAVKAVDGTTRAAECMIAAVLVKLGALDPQNPEVAAILSPDIRNWDGLITGQIRPAPSLYAG